MDRLKEAKEYALRTTIYAIFGEQQRVWVDWHKWKGFLFIHCGEVTIPQLLEIQKAVGKNFIVKVVDSRLRGGMQVQCLPVAPPQTAIPHQAPEPHRYKVGEIRHLINSCYSYTVEIVSLRGFSSDYSNGDKIYPVYEVRRRGKYGNLMAKESQHTCTMSEYYIGEVFAAPVKMRTIKQKSGL